MDDNNDTTNACFDNSGFNSANSLTQTINTKIDELKIILDNINQHHPISVI